jgi:hypothetical protein
MESWPESVRLSTRECWSWPVETAYRRDGRATASKQYIYRLLYLMLVDPDLSDDLVLHHLCGNAWCVNPWHLITKTPAEHAAEHLAERNARRRKHTCKNGHDMDDPGNVGTFTRMKDGEAREERYCRACRALWKKRRQARQRGL